MPEKEYIERERAIEAFDDPSVERYYGDVDPDSVIRVINSIPAADVRPVVRGEWLRIPSDGKFRESCLCSVCRKSPPIESWVVQGFKACPYCFADMREPPKEG